MGAGLMWGGPEGLRLGGLSLYGVPFPIAIGDRYIHLRLDDGDPICQVWRWDSAQAVAVREPDPGETGSAIILERTNEGGIGLQFTRDAVASLSGSVDDDPLRIVCTAEEIQVWHGQNLSITMSDSSISGSDVGLHVSVGGTSIGSRLPEGFDYKIDYVHRRVQLARLITSAESPVLQNLRFVSCRIEGPAVVFAAGPVAVRGGTWDMLGAPLAARSFTLPVPEWAYGVVLMKDVDFEDCDIVNVAAALPPDL